MEILDNAYITLSINWDVLLSLLKLGRKNNQNSQELFST